MTTKIRKDIENPFGYQQDFFDEEIIELDMNLETKEEKLLEEIKLSIEELDLLLLIKLRFKVDGLLNEIDEKIKKII